MISKISVTKGHIQKQPEFELGEVHKEKSFVVVSDRVLNFGILQSKKNKTIGKKRPMILDIINTIQILGIQDKNYNFLNPVNISITSDNITQKLTKYKKYRFKFILESLLFSSNFENGTDVIFVSFKGLFGAVKITKNANTSHYKCEGYAICFDSESSFSFGNRIDAENVIIFGVNTSNSSHSTNKTQNIYVLGKDFAQGINNTTIYAEKTNFTGQSKKFVLSLHCNGNNSCLFVNGIKKLKFKSSVNYLDRNLLCVGNISSYWSLTNGTKTGLYGNVYEFAIDYAGINGVTLCILCWN